MKFFAVFVAVLAVACASPAEWSVHELSAALQDSNTPVALLPLLEGALNELMAQAVSGSPQTTITVSTPVQDFSSWTLHELSEAIQDPATNPELVIYLEHALNNMMTDIMAGGQPEYVIVATPVGLLPVEAVVVPAPVEAVVVPAPVESVVTPAAASPLVQIIVNIKSQQEVAAPAPVVPELLPEAVVLPMPVLPEVVLPQPVVLPEPVLPEVILPEPVVLPMPVLPEVVLPEPVVLPAPVAPEVVPESVVNPVDIISVNPVSITNPVDVIAPLPVVVPVGALEVVGPIV